MDATPVEPGEALLVAIGLDAFVSEGRLRITAEHRRKAGSLRGAVRKELRRFLAAAEFDRERPPPEFAYKKALAAVTEPASASFLASKAPSDDAEATVLIPAVTRVFNHLNAIAPKRARQTATGAVPVPPSDGEVSRFRRAYSVAARPMLVLEDLNEGILVRDQIRTLEACYPAFYAAIKEELFTVLADLKGQRPTIELSSARDKQLQVLLQTRTWNAELARDMQNAFSQPEPGAKPKRPATKPTTEGLDTPLRRIEAR